MDKTPDHTVGCICWCMLMNVPASHIPLLRHTLHCRHVIFLPNVPQTQVQQFDPVSIVVTHQHVPVGGYRARALGMALKGHG